MSFSSQIKEQIINISGKSKCCAEAELIGILRSSINLLLNENEVKFELTTENAKLATYVQECIFNQYNLQGVAVGGDTRVRKNIIFSSNRNEKDTLKLLQDIGISLGEKDYWYEQLTPLKKKCCQRAFLRGVFLGCGSVADPNRSYHLEMVLKENIIADELCEFMISNEMNAKIIDRKNMAVVYLKEAEDISLFFNIIGAHKAMLEFEDITIMKDMRNGVNRVTNCELANLNKTLECWERQVECINLLKKKGVFESLSPKLIEIAEVRLANPEFSLAEVGKALSEPLGRSGVNHRLKKLEEMANCLK